MAKPKTKKERKARSKHSFARNLMMVSGATLLVLIVTVMLLGNFFDHPALKQPGKIISGIVNPIQTFFSDSTNVVANYFRSLKYRSNLEYEYEQLLIKVEELQDASMLANEYAARLSAYDDLEIESSAHLEMNPITATVIGHDTGNYFSTLDLNRGANDGVTDYMAVVYSGGLVGYTYDVTATTCKVATIIDSDTTIPALMESTRDQGSVKGTYGINGEASCRMYYLPENHLPRTGDTVVTSGVGMAFPKGIPIGTVRESTRGMEDNKQYVVIQPIVDFQHLEYVIIYRYIPSYAETAQLSEVTISATLVPLATARPLPTFAVGVGTSFEEGGVSVVTDEISTVEVVGTEEPETTPSPTPAPQQPVDTGTPLPPNIEYVRITATPSGPTPTPTPTPSPTPVPTVNMDSVTVEEDE